MKRIDLRFLLKRNWMTPGNRYSIGWNRGGEPSGNIQYAAYSSHLLLDYKFREGEDEDWTPIQQTVPLTRTPLHFGGERLWFQCPRCRRRCLVLYGGTRFFCRKCYRLAYQTQGEDAIQRAVTKAEKVRKKLGCDEGMDWPFPPKPKGMHWKTYRRLEEQDQRANETWDAAVIRLLSKW